MGEEATVVGEVKGAGPASLGPHTGRGALDDVCPLYLSKRKPAAAPDTDFPILFDCPDSAPAAEHKSCTHQMIR